MRAKKVMLLILLLSLFVGNHPALACTMTAEKGEPDSFTGLCDSTSYLVAREITKTVHWNLYVFNANGVLEGAAINLSF